MTQRDTSVDSILDLGAAWPLASTSFELADRAYQTWLVSTQRIQNEAFEFLSGRVEKALATARELGSCTNPADYLFVQAKYAESAVADWLAESQKLADLIGEIAQESTDGNANSKPHAKRSGNGHGRGTH